MTFEIFLGCIAVFILYQMFESWRTINKKRKDEIQEIKDRIVHNIELSKRETKRMRECYEPTYAEVQNFYQRYVDRIKQRVEDYEGQGIWDTEEPEIMTLEEYLDEFIENEYYGNNLYYYMARKCAFMFVHDPRTGGIEIWM